MSHTNITALTAAEQARLRRMLEDASAAALDARERLAAAHPTFPYANAESKAAYSASCECRTMLDFLEHLGAADTLYVNHIMRTISTAMAAAAACLDEADSHAAFDDAWDKHLNNIAEGTATGRRVLVG